LAQLTEGESLLALRARSLRRPWLAVFGSAHPPSTHWRESPALLLWSSQQQKAADTLRPPTAPVGAIADCKQAVKLDPTKVVTYGQRADAGQATGPRRQSFT
jgi:hypothetical protein